MLHILFSRAQSQSLGFYSFTAPVLFDIAWPSEKKWGLGELDLTLVVQAIEVVQHPVMS